MPWNPNETDNVTWRLRHLLPESTTSFSVQYFVIMVTKRAEDGAFVAEAYGKMTGQMRKRIVRRDYRAIRDFVSAWRMTDADQVH